MPNINGNITIPIINNINVLIKEIIDDTLQFENAVNIPLANILNPFINNPYEKRLKPFNVISKIVLFLGVNIEIKTPDINLQIINEHNAKISIVI